MEKKNTKNDSQAVVTSKKGTIAKGGRTTISPPANINRAINSKIKKLAHNIDTLQLSIDIIWRDPSFFTKLGDVKKIAKENNREQPISLQFNDATTDEYLFNVKPHGAQGSEWIILNRDYSLLIGNWEKPISRPSVLLTIKSETLWHLGPSEAVSLILTLLNDQGAEITQCKISRLDLCVDAMFPTALWTPELLNYKVTSATSARTYFSHGQLSGISIGKGKFSARMYDKPLEIQQQSKKDWLYKFWKLESVPQGYRIIRTEFQLRREAIKELGIHTLNTLFCEIQNIWAYCTKDWLNFRDNPHKQYNQRKTLLWWKNIQDDFCMLSTVTPLVRVPTLNPEKEALSIQILGLISSFAALEIENSDRYDHIQLDLGSVLESFYEFVHLNNLIDDDFEERVDRKITKYQRIRSKMMKLLELRADNYNTSEIQNRNSKEK